MSTCQINLSAIIPSWCKLSVAHEFLVPFSRVTRTCRDARDKLSLAARIFQSEKRRVPTLLRKVLAVDAYLTDEFVKLTEKLLPLKRSKVHYRLLEVRLIDSLVGFTFRRTGVIQCRACS